MSVSDVRPDCGCCEGLQYRTPARLFNRPGLSEITYRMGTYGQFKQSMIAGLTHAGRPTLFGLQTRADDDFSIALIDAWAVTADVLTFYMERIANEHYLSTATERRSIDEMGRLLSYRPRPGVAASTWLAFMLESSPDPENDMRPMASPGVPERSPIREGVQVQSIPGPDEEPQTFETIEDIDAHVDWNLLQPQQTKVAWPDTEHTSAWLDGIGLNLSRGDVLMFVSADDATQWELVRITAVDPDGASQRTEVTWRPALSEFDGETPVDVYAMRQRGALFGFNAPDPSLFHPDVRNDLPVEVVPVEDDQEPENGDDEAGDTKWEWKFAGIKNETLYLDTVYSAIDPESLIVFRNPSEDVDDLLTTVTSVGETARSGYGLSNKVTSLMVEGNNDDLSEFARERTRDTIIYLGSEKLALAEYPIEDALEGNEIPLSHSLEPMEWPRNAVIRGEAAEDDPSGAGPGEPVAEPIVIVDIEQEGDRAKLILKDDLQHRYDRTTTEILGNVARATHGERVEEEVLGSGDGSKPYQQFTLKQKPLTYVRGETPGRPESTLEVYVNGVRWREAPSFFGQGPQARIYVTSINDEGETVVQFGDGDDGARLPAGNNNVVATYRHGSGPDGHLEAGQISLLMTRPLAVHSGENPTAPSGATERQSRDDARENAPRSVITLERIVSLRDYEDFARDFPGVEKAAAVWTWDGERRGVLVTIAGADGEMIAPGSVVYDDLEDAIESSSPGRVPIEIQSHRPVTFRLKVEVSVDPQYLPESVLAAVGEMLLERFSFRTREFGQMVKRSDIYAAIHAVEGVTAARITALHRTDESPQLKEFLVAEMPLNGTPPEIEGAELLLLTSESLEELEQMP